MKHHSAPTITIIPAKPALVAGRESTTYFLIRIEPPAPEPRAERRRLNLGIVLDRSGSMAGDKLVRAKEAVAFALRNMAPDDLVSLTIYDDRVRMLVPALPVSEAAARILALLPGIDAGRTTALYDAWVQGSIAVSRRLDPERLNRVLLISDGLANVGVIDPETIVTRVRELFSSGVSTSTIGIGSDFNEDLMIPMAVSGGGVGWFVESPADLKRIFEAELAGLAALYSDKGALRIEPRRPGTKVVEILNDLPSGPEGWRIGDLNHGQPLEIVARVAAHGGEPGQPLDLFDVRLWLELPGQGRIELQQLARVTGGEAERVAAMPVHPDVDRAVELLSAARARRETVEFIDRGDYESARDLTAQWSLRMSRLHARLGDEEARLDAGQFRDLGSLLRATQHPGPARSLARKRASYQRYFRAWRSGRSG
ncbi:MAG: VWA domain-containing protein [Gemmatimonadota bacterium]